MFAILYLIFIIFFITSSRYKKRYLSKVKDYSKENFVSVVIPAKDEEKNIKDILNSVLKQNYPKDKYEVVLVNDRSEDGTQKIAESFLEGNENLKIIQLTEKGETLSGKQNALDVGIKASKGEIILITDADCVVNKNWVKSMARLFYREDIGIVVGKTEILEEEKKSFLYKFQVLVHRLLMDAAQVPIMFGFYTSGMGNNLAFKKSGYLDLGGYEGLGDSILDDEILVRGFARKGYKVAAAFSKNAVVKTKGMETCYKLFIQHKRWIVGSMNIFTPSGLLTFISYGLNIYTVYLFYQFIRFGNPLFMLKILADYLLIIKLNRTEDGKILNWFDEIIFAFFITIYLLLQGTASIVNPKTKWKNQSYKAPKSVRDKK